MKTSIEPLQDGRFAVIAVSGGRTPRVAEMMRGTREECEACEKGGVYVYRQFEIACNMVGFVGGSEWEYIHPEYIGPGDGSKEERDVRCGLASSFDEAKSLVDDYWAEREEAALLQAMERDLRDSDTSEPLGEATVAEALADLREQDECRAWRERERT